VHGITSIHKAEVSAQANGLNMRGLNKGDLDGVVAVGERGERSIISERERTSLKNEARFVFFSTSCSILLFNV
jgi:hypothetical protein